MFKQLDVYFPRDVSDIIGRYALGEHLIELEEGYCDVMRHRRESSTEEVVMERPYFDYELGLFVRHREYYEVMQTEHSFRKQLWSNYKETLEYVHPMPRRYDGSSYCMVMFSDGTIEKWEHVPNIYEEGDRMILTYGLFDDEDGDYGRRDYEKELKDNPEYERVMRSNMLNGLSGGLKIMIGLIGAYLIIDAAIDIIKIAVED